MKMWKNQFAQWSSSIGTSKYSRLGSLILLTQEPTAKVRSKLGNADYDRRMQGQPAADVSYLRMLLEDRGQRPNPHLPVV